MKDYEIKQNILLERHSKDLVCNSNTDIVIEGYPRSGNSFFVRYFNLNNKLRISHHTHSKENVAIGLSLSKPIIILVRNPLDAILSFMVFSGASVEIASRRYVDFYSFILNNSNHILLADFEDVIVNPDRIINKASEMFDMELHLSKNSTQDILAVKSQQVEQGKLSRSGDDYIRKTGTPIPEREEIKKSLSSLVRNFMTAHPEIRSTYLKLKN